MVTKIEWVVNGDGTQGETLNPLGFWCFGPTGTRENPAPCPYCYAKIMAKRGMTKCELCKTFTTPHTHFEQLEKLKKWKKPRTIFMQSMGDLLHDEVPDEWIEEVFKACEGASHHTFLFLSKNPKRYIELSSGSKLPYNHWYGTTAIDDYDDVLCSGIHNTFVSCEPIHGEIDIRLFNGGHPKSKQNLIIVGMETGNRRGKTIPKREWIENIVEDCNETDIPVFLKNNLIGVCEEDYVKRHQHVPWRDAI